jgi:hypothetical protein
MEDKELYQRLLNEISSKSKITETPSNPVSPASSNIDEYLMALRGEKSFIPDIREESVLNDYVKQTRTTTGEMNLNEQEILTPQDKNYVTRKEFETQNKSQSVLIQNIQKSLSLGGGGEKEFRYLDDVNRSTMTGNNNNWLLEYDANSKKVQFTTDLGPINTLKFDRNHTHEEFPEVGQLCWSEQDQTLNLQHPNGVTQQIGQETYAKVRNKTGSTIPNGTAVRFAGAEQDGTARLLVAPFQANNVYPSLYGLGITTENIENGADGRVTVWGKVREVNTSAFNVGDVLYVSTTVAGGLTNVKPTAPNNVVPMAAVLRVDSSAGEIFVRPNYEQQKNYGNFVSDSDQTLSLANTPTPIRLSRDLVAQQMQYQDSDRTRIQVFESGLYAVTVNAQITSTNSSSKNVYFWLRKNDSDLTGTTRIVTVSGNAVFGTFSSTNTVSLDTNDTLQHMWAATNATVTLHAVPATAFAPSSPSVKIDITQAAL